MKKWLWAFLVVALNGSMSAWAASNAAKIDAPSAYALYNDKQYKQAYQLWYPQAVKGDSVAQYVIGVMLMHGQGVSPNRPQALKWLHKAAEQREVEAMRQLMWLYGEGKYVMQDSKQARLWAENLEAAGDDAGVKFLANADSESKDLSVLNRAIERHLSYIDKEPEFYFEQYRLGMAYAHRSHFIEADKDLAYDWLALSEKNSPDGFSRFPMLGRYFVAGKDPATDGTEYQRNLVLAEKGDVIAQYHVANYLRYEKKDLPAYWKWLNTAAAAGYAHAQYDKGQGHEAASLCASGLDNDPNAPQRRVPVVDATKAVDATEAVEAREAGQHHARWDDNFPCEQSELPKERVSAMSVPELDALSQSESDKALEWYRKAAAQKHPDALYKLYEYWRGDRTKQIDKETALDALRESAELGSTSAPDSLAEMYFKGEGGLQKDLKQALHWYEKSAEYGIHAGANLYVAQFYCKGMGVPKDDDLCRHHLFEAQESVGDDIDLYATDLGLMPYVRKFLKHHKRPVCTADDCKKAGQ